MGFDFLSAPLEFERYEKSQVSFIVVYFIMLNYKSLFDSSREESALIISGLIFRSFFFYIG